MAKVEILGLEKVRAAFKGAGMDLTPYVLRDMARKPAIRGANIARHLQPIGESGATAKTIGVTRVKNPKQPFVEVGYRGRSLGHIYTSGETITRSKRGTVKGFPWLFKKAGDTLGASGRNELRVDLTKAFVRSFKSRGVGR